MNEAACRNHALKNNGNPRIFIPDLGFISYNARKKAGHAPRPAWYAGRHWAAGIRQ